MIFWWMGYAAGIGVLLAGGAWAGERLCENMGWPRRFPWVAALTLAVVIPLSARAPAPVLEVSAAAPSPVTSVVQAADPAVPAISGTVWERAAIVAWGAASLVTLLVFGTILGLMTRSRRRWPRRSVDGEDVYVSDGFGPALIGVTRPSVVIPDWLLCAGDQAGRVAILHEREHARARDHLTLLYGAIIAALFPWSPAVWWMVRNLRGAVEIDCDRRVIASGVPADDYGELLLAIGVGQHRRWMLTPALLESRHSLERRLKIMAARKMKWSPLRAVRLAGLTVAAVVIACDTNAPTALDDALLDVLAKPGGGGQRRRIPHPAGEGRGDGGGAVEEQRTRNRAQAPDLHRRRRGVEFGRLAWGRHIHGQDRQRPVLATEFPEPGRHRTDRGHQGIGRNRLVRRRGRERRHSDLHEGIRGF